MSKITMPKPVAQQIRYFDSNALSRTYGEWSEWKMFTGKYERMGLNEKRALITTDQAEAYADARVREVLRSLLRDMNGHVRAAHSRFGETGKPYDEGRRIAYEQAAADIRALIPPPPGPVEPTT